MFFEVIESRDGDDGKKTEWRLDLRKLMKFGGHPSHCSSVLVALASKSFGKSFEEKKDVFKMSVEKGEKNDKLQTKENRKVKNDGKKTKEIEVRKRSNSS